MEALQHECTSVTATGVSHTVHDGCFFAAEYFGRSEPLSPVSTLLLDMSDDLLSAMADSLVDHGNLAALLVARCTCTRWQVIADEALRRISSAEIATALASRALPAESECHAARRVGVAFLAGQLPIGAAQDVVRWANLELQKVGAPVWELWNAANGAIPNGDQLVELRGIDEQPVHMAPSSDPSLTVARWHEEHLPHVPLRRPHLPCMLVGPSRLRALALPSRERRRNTRVPLELCSISRVRVSCHENHPLASFLAAVLVGYDPSIDITDQYADNYPPGR